MNTTLEESIRIVIIDSYTLVRVGLRLIIERESDMFVVGDAGEVEEALEIVRLQKPDIILLKLDPLTDIEPDIIPKLLIESNFSRIILLARKDEAEMNLGALKKGALGIVFKTQTPEILIKAIQKVNIGEVWIERSLIANVLNDLANHKNSIDQDPDRKHIAELTNRERDVILLIGRGLKNQQIAHQLHLSETTIRHHLTSIYNKLGVTSRLELLVFANHNQLV